MTKVSGSSDSEIDSIYDNWASELGGNTWYRGLVGHNILHSILGGGTFYIEGFKMSDFYEWQTSRSYSSISIIEYVRSKHNGTWTSWTKR